LNKKFIGGLDIVKDLISDGDFESMVPEGSRKVNSKERLI